MQKNIFTSKWKEKLCPIGKFEQDKLYIDLAGMQKPETASTAILCAKHVGKVY